MHFLTTALLFACTATATLQPALMNSKNRCPTHYNCSPAKTSKAIQAAECAYNTRTSTTQTFAVFTTDHQYDGNHGAPYGTCEAYTCAVPKTPGEMKDCAGSWTFFWDRAHGKNKGVGTGCIRDPQTGECGCEDSDGTFTAGKTDCK
ncbi:hypothetical protein LTR56_017992 [Elasticomyces elasticus]|nr:hypothetical protein LTR56_017992 [Elasticomyces elasticus]KAK3637193.1 hypothetical protein LTR22_018383 [Elasticomyces elasticus]KAK4888619.1 hypothetical protein LTR27_012514 [Elasticomyces elasticus]KAK4914266.1 hypothetical protein LTR49_017509 [Elasticomyces elasticus]KAK4950683.1 hypothetical protein LTR10_010676 [Elasticomyces elasticus]